MFENNIKFLSKKTKEKLLNTIERDIVFKKSKNNLFVPIYKGLTFHSLYNPLQEGEKYNFTNNEIIISIGFGCGYHLIEAFKNGAKILVIPIDYILLKSVLNKIDLSNFFDSNFLFFITLDELIDYFDFNYTNYRIVVHPVIERLYSKEVLEIIKSVKKILNDVIIEINTYKKFGKIWLKNLMKNLFFIYNEESKINWNDLIIDKIILITGAGPSLEENIDFIKKFREEFFLASSDTSLKILTSYNIDPDVVFTFDAQVFSLYHFMNYKGKARIFFDLLSPFHYFKNITPVFSNYPLLIKLKEIWDYPVLFTRTRNIGGAMIEFFCHYFPSIPIIVIGVDYGVKNFKIYSKGTYIDEYQQIDSSFYNSIEQQNSIMFYKNNLIKNNNWYTTPLLKNYSENLAIFKKVYTLSDSPFLTLNRICENEIISLKKEIKKTSLYFNKPLIKEILFNFIIENIKKNPDLINIYFYASKNEKIEDLINYLKKLFNLS